MFAGQPVSKQYIDVDPHGFTIDGKRTFLVSAGMEYARIPRELWKDRLLRLKRGGFNCVEVYTFWNFHEAQEGRFEFSGDHDLDAFLKLVKELGMYCIPRVGPYYCAEWDFGGYPHWLRQKEGMVVRTADPQFLKYMDRFFEKLIPIIAQNQIHKGGSVILVQLENEHPASWGTYLHDAYFTHLQQSALQLGVEVPYFFSGMHHGHDPAENTKDLFDPNRPSPWFSTEYWSVWFDKYGSGQAEADVFGRRTWKIITRGGNGYNVYMAHGGTNFGYTNDDEDAASYDYGAAVGQTGDLRPLYYQFKKNALFARSFEEILENSTATHAYDHISKVARTSEKGDVITLENNNMEETRVTYVRIDGKKYPKAGQLVLDPGEILPLVHNFELSAHVTLDWSVVRVLGVQKTGNTTTVVVYGKVGSFGDLLFKTAGEVVLQSDPAAFDTGRLTLHVEFSAGRPNVYSFGVGNESIRIVAVDAGLADRTWFVDNHVIVGPSYVGEVWKDDSLFRMQCERPWDVAGSNRVYVYDEAGEKTFRDGAYVLVHPEQLLLTGEWEAKDAVIPVGTKKTKFPLQMGADGDTSAYVWYTTSVNLPADGTCSFDISQGQGRYIVYLDGKKVSDGLTFTGTKGTHAVTILATHDGRDKLVSYVGKLDVDVKGIEGPVTLHKGTIPYFRDWQFLPGGDSGHIPPSYKDAVTYKAGDDAFDGKEACGWFHTSVADVPDSLFFNSVDDNAVVYINGQRVGAQQGWDKPFTVPFPKKGDIDVFVCNNAGRGGLGEKIRGIYKADQQVTGWQMKGGPGAIGTAHVQTGAPVYYKNHFDLDAVAPNERPMWRVTFEGLSHGFMWVNGHNLGRYPEVIPTDGLYIPECWLRKGENELLIFDEYGHSPERVKIKAEQQASRYVYEIRE
jgi:beta-galactosidase